MVVFESPSSVTEFATGAFADCSSLEFISIPPSLIHIRNSCFELDECLSEVIIESPSRLTSIGSGVFGDCRRLSSFYIPRHLQILNGMSFAYSGIIDVEVDPENESFRMINSYLINLVTHSIVRFFSRESSAVISNSIQELGPDAFAESISLATVTFESH
jgi:hypothetical protein